MRKILWAAVVTLALAGVAEAGNRGPHPVFGWNGNEYLFEVQERSGVIQLTGYRAIGAKWQLVGTTTIRAGQTAPDRGWLQRVWFKGERLGKVEADLSNPFWRYYPADDRNGGGGGGIFN